MIKDIVSTIFAYLLVIPIIILQSISWILLILDWILLETNNIIEKERDKLIEIGSKLLRD